MTSHTKVGVKLQRSVIENVWEFCTPDLLINNQALAEPGITGCNAVAVRSSCQSNIYLGRCGCACMLIHGYRPVFIHVLNLCGLSQPRNCFNSKLS